MKKKTVVAVLVAVILLCLLIPFKSEKSEYGGCDIAERTERVSLLLGNNIEKAKQSQTDCHSYVTYKLYVL